MELNKEEESPTSVTADPKKVNDDIGGRLKKLGTI